MAGPVDRRWVSNLSNTDVTTIVINTNMLLLVLDVTSILFLGLFPHVPGGSRSWALVQEVDLVGGRAAPLGHLVQAYAPA